MLTCTAHTPHANGWQTVGRPARNHHLHDQIGGQSKADFKGTKDKEGVASFSWGSTKKALKENMERHYPGHTVVIVEVKYAWDFTLLEVQLKELNGNSKHRLLTLTPTQGEVGSVDSRMYRDLASPKPVYMTLKEGGIKENPTIWTGGADVGKAPLSMAPHDQKGIRKATKGKETLKKVLNEWRAHALRAPRGAPGDAAAHFKRLADGVDSDIWVPASVDDEPPEFRIGRAIPPGLVKQSATIVQDAVRGVDRVVPSAIIPDAPHVGGGKMMRSAHIELPDVPIAAVFQCADGNGAAPCPALAMVIAVKVDAKGDTIYRCRWCSDPAGDGTSSAKCSFVSEDGQATFIGPPEYILVTADVRFNNARNQSARTWAKATGYLSVNASGVRLWKTISAEVEARANPNAPAVPSALLTEHESRCREGDSEEDEEMGE